MDDVFVALMRSLRPEWQRDALCREHPEVSWFVEQGESAADARAVCDRCLVRSECLGYAIEQRIEQGVWGGLTPRQRHKLARRESGSEPTAA